VIPSPPRSYIQRTAWLFRPCVGASAYLLGGSSLAMAAATTETKVSQQEMTFVSLQLGNTKLSDGIDAVLLPDNKICLDFDAFVNALEFQIKYTPEDDTAKGWFLDETRLFQLDMKAKRVNIGGIARNFPEGAILRTDLGLCVSTEVLQSWFPVDFSYEPQGALIELTSREPLPVELKLAREARKITLEDGQTETESTESIIGKTIGYDWFRIPNVDIFARADFSQNEYGSGRRSVAYSAAAVGELAKMTSEFSLQSDSSARPGSVRLRLYRRDQNGGVFGVPGLTDFVIGDVSGISNSLLNNSAPGRGISLSSYPLSSSDEYDRTTLRGDVPQGWESELYRNDALVAFENANTTGRYEFKDVPVFSGINEFKIVLYGPQGQRREIRKIVNGGGTGIPRGKLFGRAVIQQDNRELISLRKSNGPRAPAPLRYQAEVRYGLFSNLSLASSISSFEVQGKRETYGTLGIQTSVGRTSLAIDAISNTAGNWSAEVAAQRSFRNIGVQLRHAQFAPGFGSQKIKSGIKSRTDLSITTSPRLFNGLTLPISVRTNIIRQYDGSSQANMSEQASITFGTHSIAQSLNADYDLSGTQPATISGSLLYSKRLHASGIHAVAGYNLSPKLEVQSVGLGYDQYIGTGSKAWYWSGNADWQLREKIGSLNLGASHQFDQFLFNVNTSANTRGAWGIGLSMSFSLAKNPVEQKWSMTAEPAAQSGNVIARVFEDIDNSGDFNDGDIPLKNAEIMAGTDKDQKTDSNGRVFITGLSSNMVSVLHAQAPANYKVDLVEGKANNAVVARAGTVNSIDIPMIVSGSVEGEISLLRDGTTRPLRGIAVKLVGEKQTILQYTEYDGYYLFQDVPTGPYHVELDEMQLQSLGLAGPLSKVTDVSRKRPYPAGLNFKLTPAAKTIVASNSALQDGRMAVKSMFSDAMAGSYERPHIATLKALFGDEIMDLPLQSKPDTKVTLVALFGDEVMDLALPEPHTLPAEKLPPTIVVIGPRFEETLASERRPVMPDIQAPTI
jgi:hypothetical protein